MSDFLLFIAAATVYYAVLYATILALIECFASVRRRWRAFRSDDTQQTTPIDP